GALPRWTAPRHGPGTTGFLPGTRQALLSDLELIYDETGPTPGQRRPRGEDGAGRDPGPGLHPDDDGPVGDAVPGRHGRRGDQGGAARRGGVGARAARGRPAARRAEPVLPGHEPAQEEPDPPP